MPSIPRSPGPFALVLLAVLGTWSSQVRGSEALRDRCGELRDEVRRIVVAEFGGLLAPDPDAVGIWLVCDHAHLGEPLRVLLQRHRGRWLPALGELGWRRGRIHRVEVLELALEGSRLRGRIRCDYREGRKHGYRSHGVTTDHRPSVVPLELALDARIEDGRLVGRFRIDGESGAVADRCRGFVARADAHAGAARWRVRLAGALDGRDLHLVLIDPGTGALPVAVQAVAPRWNKAAHACAVEESTGGDDGVVHLATRLVLRGDGWVPGKLARLETDLAIAIATDGPRLTGRYRIAAAHERVPEREGTIHGIVEPLLPQGRAPRVSDSAEDATAGDLLAAARRDYALIRALRSARRDGVPFEHRLPPAWSGGGDAHDPGSAAARVADLLRLAALPVGGEVLRGNRATPDPAFGPWYGSAALAHPTDDAHDLAAATARPAHGDWWQLAAWRISRPIARRPAELGDMQELAPVAAAECDAWDPVVDDDGWIDPPEWEEATLRQLDGCRYLAATAIRAAEPRTVHLALRSGSHFDKWGNNGRGDCRVWLNGRALWQSDEREADLREHQAILAVDLVGGVNRLLVEISGDRPVGFGCWLNAVGEPRAADAVAAGEAARRDRLAEDPPPRLYGYRGNFTGSFPDARPITAWDPVEGTNVRWRHELPSFSNATPLVVGDAVLVNCEPHRLYCYDKRSGELRWQADSDPLDLLPDEEGAAIGADLRRAEDLDRTRSELKKRRRVLRGQVEAGRDVAGELAAVESELDAIARRLRAHEEAFARAHRPSPTWGAFMGATFATPTSDGELVIVKYGSGIVAAYRIEDGRRLWMLREPIEPNVYETSSPVCVGDVVICRWKHGKNLHHHGAGSLYVARDPATGEERWRTVVSKRTAGGTPMPVRLSDGREVMDVLVTHEGAVLRVADGEVLLHDIGFAPSSGWTIVSVADDRVYVPLYWNNMAAVQLVMRDRDTVGARRLWYPTWWGGGTHHFHTGDHALVHDGKVYCNTVVKEHDLKSPTGWQLFKIVDAETGEIRKQIKPVMRSVAHCYTPLALGGDHLFLTDSGDPGSSCFDARPGGPSHESMIGVLDWTAGCQAVAMNPHHRMQAPPTFDGELTFIRTHGEIICVGPTEEGRAHVRDEAARTLFGEIARWPVPERTAVRELAPLDLSRPPGPEVLVGDFHAGDAAPAIGLIGPFPRDDLPAAPRFDADHLPREGRAGCSRLAEALVVEGRSLREWSLDFAAAMERRERTSAWFCSLLRVSRSQCVRLVGTFRGSFALGGVELDRAHLYRLRPGHYPILIRLDLDRPPPPHLRPVASFHLQERPDPALALRRWRAQVAPFRSRLEEVARGGEDGRARFRAEFLLRLLDGDEETPDP